MYKYSMTQWIVGNENIEESFQRLQKYGYDGIEFAAEPYSLDGEKMRRLMNDYQLICTSLCGIFNDERDLTAGEPKKAEKAIQYLKDSVDFAVEVGAAYLIVVPSPVGRTQPPEEYGYEEAWEQAVNNIRTAADYAQEKGICFVIEAIKRYETYLVNNLEKALEFVKEINHPSVGLMADLFHMGIEERNIGQSLRKIAPWLRHVHLADNTREAPGMGGTDFKEVLRTLKEIGYQGALTMEFLPRIANPYAAKEMGTHKSLMDKYAEISISYIKMLEAATSV